MTSIDRTAYPRFRKKALDRELATAYTPTDDEIELFNRKFSKSAPHRLAYAMLFKSFQRLGYLPAVAVVPLYVVVHLRTCLKLRRNVVPSPLGEATYRRYQKDILKRCKARRFGRDALHAAAEAMAEAAAVQDHPADIINASLAVLGRERFELPAFSTLDRLCRRVRTTINTRVFAGIDARLSEADKAHLDALLDVPGGGKSLLFQLKKRAQGLCDQPARPAGPFGLSGRPRTGRGRVGRGPACEAAALRRRGGRDGCQRAARLRAGEAARPAGVPARTRPCHHAR
jgi:hypothetical protein